jgi:hypothetical protein
MPGPMDAAKRPTRLTEPTAMKPNSLKGIAQADAGTNAGSCSCDLKNSTIVAA